MSSRDTKPVTEWWGKREEISIFRGPRHWKIEIRKYADKKITIIHVAWIQQQNDLQLAVGETLLVQVEG